MAETAHSDPADRLAEWETLLKQAGHRITIPRRVILQSVMEQGGAFDAEQLLASARQVDELISLATIYRTINVLEDCDLVRQIDGVGEKQQYEVGSGVDTQAYLVCDECGKTIPLHDDCLILRERFMIKQMGYTVRQVNLRVRVCCDAHSAN
ncbi:Fur family transcriptional regulator [Cerasicoccus fimbriatus]|uniref:Fur family transcriptional regulator n=1 Tax=Cerasicoccus fimbriatus TaxID=3014554 RepID=UPI0022B4C8BC|nr:transcriptional repressor [Cerasicoccus sp. TK19100]